MNGTSGSVIFGSCFAMIIMLLCPENTCSNYLAGAFSAFVRRKFSLPPTVAISKYRIYFNNFPLENSTGLTAQLWRSKITVSSGRFAKTRGMEGSLLSFKCSFLL